MEHLFYTLYINSSKMKLHTVQLIFLLYYTDSKLQTDSLQKVQTSLSQCVVKVCRNFPFQLVNLNLYFQNMSMSSAFYDLLVNDLSKIPNNTYKIFNARSSYFISFKNDIYEINNNYILDMSSYNKFITFLKKLSDYKHWNPAAYFLIFSYNYFLKPELISDQLFTGLHKEGVINGVILLLKEKNSTIFNMYTTQSFTQKFANKTLIVNSCDFGKFSNSRPLYPKERTEEISKKTIQIGYIGCEPYCVEHLTSKVNNRLTGIEINLINTITDKLKIKVQYIKSKMPRGNVYSNGTFTNEFVSLHKKRLDMIIGGYVLSPARMIYFIQTCPFLKQTMVWCVPHQYIYPHSLNSNLLFLFNIVLVYAILIIILWVVDRKQRPAFRMYENVSHLILNSWGVLLGKPTVLLPKSNKLRYFIILMLLFAFEINIIITSKMTTSFIKAYRVEKYDSLKKIYDHNLTTYFVKNSMMYFANRETDDGVSFETIVHKENVCSNQIECLKNVATGTSAFFLPNHRKNYLLQHLKENKTAIYCFTFINYVYVSGIMRKGFPFTRQFNKIIGELSSAGIIDHWKRGMFMGQKKEESRRLKKLSTRDIQTAIYILACGYIFSFIIFLVEIYFSCSGI